MPAKRDSQHRVPTRCLAPGIRVSGFLTRVSLRLPVIQTRTISRPSVIGNRSTHPPPQLGQFQRPTVVIADCAVAEPSFALSQPNCWIVLSQPGLVRGDLFGFSSFKHQYFTCATTRSVTGTLSKMKRHPWALTPSAPSEATFDPLFIDPFFRSRSDCTE